MAGSSRATATAILRSSRFIKRRICAEERRSRFLLAGLRCSVRRRSSDRRFRVAVGILGIIWRGGTGFQVGVRRLLMPEGYYPAGNTAGGGVSRGREWAYARAVPGGDRLFGTKPAGEGKRPLMDVLKKLFEERFATPAERVQPLQGELGG